MKKLITLSLISLSLICYADGPVVPASAVIVDTIEAVILGAGGVEIVTQSDVARPSLAGTPRTKDEIIFERLVFLDAQKFHIMAEEDAVDRYLANIQKENNLTLDQIKDVFQAAGYTYEEGREQFRRLQTVNSMLEFQIRSQLTPPRRQVEEYYAQHPVEQEASYHLQYGFVPFKGDDKDEQKQEVERRLSEGRDPRGVSWDDPFWIDASEISEEKSFILNLKAGQASSALERTEGFEVYRVLDRKDKRLVPLEERYREIVTILIQPRYQELMDKYKKQLFDTASIIDLKGL